MTMSVSEQLGRSTASAFGSSGRSSSNSSQAAARLAEFQDVLTRDLMEDISDRLIEIRLEVPWKHNPQRFPQVYHIDRHGVCRYAQALVDKEEAAWRVWIIDVFGAIKGVLGAFGWDDQ